MVELIEDVICPNKKRRGEKCVYLTSFEETLAQVLYQDQNVVELIGDVICPNKKRRGEKCVYLRSFEEINKSTYQCKQCKACSRVLNILFKDQKPCVSLFGRTYCFTKENKFGLPKRETLASNATVQPPIKTLHDKSRGS